MTKAFFTAFASTLMVAMASIPPASAQTVCAAGLENVAGTCVTAGLAGSMRERGVLMNQLKIGYNLPIAPRRDNLYPKNFDVNRFEFSQPGNFSTSPFPPSP